MSVTSTWREERAGEIIAAHRAPKGGALPALQALQAEFGFIPPEAVLAVAEALNLTRAEVHGVLTFYHDLRTEPAGRHVLKLCRAEACQSMGADALAQHTLGRVGVEWGGTTPGGGLTVEPVFCLGLCACAPSALLDGEPVARLTPERIDALLDGLA
ncbi:MAG: formate dehydrogenase subunit gamma [Alphaproteobacteria bacterium]|nr:formate dehydrogenase subunit gamma [Rhodospirillales bacterium]MBN9561478.1 formate dehydrogenase subunit gamma [Alphaproteobacteria bacterium]